MKDIFRLSEILGFKIPLDGLMMAITGRPTIDFLALDKRLVEVYNYQGSMNDFIVSKFGIEAMKIIDKN